MEIDGLLKILVILFVGITFLYDFFAKRKANKLKNSFYIAEQQKKISLLKEIISDNGVAYVVFGSKSTDRFVPYEIINENDIANCKVKGYFPGYVYPEEDESGQKRLFLFKIVDISHVSRSYLNTDKGGASAEHVDKTNAGYKCYTQTDYNRYKHIDYIYLFRISLLKTLIRHNGTATIEYGKIKWNCFRPVVLLNEDDKEHCVVKGYLPGYIPYFQEKKKYTLSKYMILKVFMLIQNRYIGRSIATMMN